MYKLILTPYGDSIQRINDDGSMSYIPLNPANVDYQEYLRWLNEGNAPEPADEPSKD